MARQFQQATDRAAIDRNLRAPGDSVLASIAPVGNAGEARAVVAATATMINNSYRSNGVPGVVLMALRDRRGNRLFFSPEGGKARLEAGPDAILGLAIVREAAGRMGAQVTLEEGIGGRGCGFTVKLP